MVDLNKLSATQRKELLAQLQEKELNDKSNRREAYEKLKGDLLERVGCRTQKTASVVRELYDFVVGETSAFYELMREYGELRNEKQQTFSIKNETFKIEVRSNKVKAFDERADMAAARLIEFLRAWVVTQDKGEDNPMYQLTMLLLERNKNGDLDYKSISKLYEMEVRFNNSEYTAIMELFKESNIVEKTAVNFYFFNKNELGVWQKLEPSFNRL